MLRRIKVWLLLGGGLLGAWVWAQAPAEFPPAQLQAVPPGAWRGLYQPPQAVPGGIAVLALNDNGPAPPHITYQGERVLVMRQGGAWFAVVGVPLDTAPGLYYALDQTGRARYGFTVQAKAYTEQHITLKNERQVNPNAQDMQRIRRETEIIQAALRQPWRDWEAGARLPLGKPVEGAFNGSFGLRRYFNGQARKPHSGEDISAPLGTPVNAPADGVVVNTGDYFFNGNSVFLDHGQGLLSMYCHLDSVRVQPGQQVRAGELLGSVGKTGRATGPHLHWGVRLNGTWVNPGLLLENPLE